MFYRNYLLVYTEFESFINLENEMVVKVGLYMNRINLKRFAAKLHELYVWFIQSNTLTNAVRFGMSF